MTGRDDDTIGFYTGNAAAYTSRGQAADRGVQTIHRARPFERIERQVGYGVAVVGRQDLVDVGDAVGPPVGRAVRAVARNAAKVGGQRPARR